MPGDQKLPRKKNIRELRILTLVLNEYMNCAMGNETEMGKCWHLRVVHEHQPLIWKFACAISIDLPWSNSEMLFTKRVL